MRLKPQAWSFLVIVIVLSMPFCVQSPRFYGVWSEYDLLTGATRSFEYRFWRLTDHTSTFASPFAPAGTAPEWRRWGGHGVASGCTWGTFSESIWRVRDIDKALQWGVGERTISDREARAVFVRALALARESKVRELKCLSQEVSSAAFDEPAATPPK